jgi:hypothetical protein
VAAPGRSSAAIRDRDAATEQVQVQAVPEPDPVMVPAARVEAAWDRPARPAKAREEAPPPRDVLNVSS